MIRYINGLLILFPKDSLLVATNMHLGVFRGFHETGHFGRGADHIII